MPGQVVVMGSGYGSKVEMVEMGWNLVVFGLYRVKIDCPKASPSHSDVLRPENGKNFFGLGVYQQSLGKKFARNVQNALPGE